MVISDLAVSPRVDVAMWLENQDGLILAMLAQFLMLGRQLSEMNNKLVVARSPVEVHRAASAVHGAAGGPFALGTDASFASYYVLGEDVYE